MRERHEKKLLEDIAVFDSQTGMNYHSYYDKTEDVYYYFLPSHMDVTKIQLSIPYKYDVRIEGKQLQNLDALPINIGQNISVTCKNTYLEQTGVLCFVQNTNIPSVYIQTQSGSTDFIHKDKTHSGKAVVRVSNVDGDIEFEEVFF